MLRQVGEEFIILKVKRQTNGELGSLQPPFLLLSCFAAASLALSLSLPTRSGTTICSRQLGYQPTACFHEAAQPIKGRTIKDSNSSSIFPPLSNLLWGSYLNLRSLQEAKRAVCGGRRLENGDKCLRYICRSRLKAI